jgi:hypothetical protein
LDRLASEGKLQTTEYGFGLQEVPASIFLGPGQHGPNPEMRGFLGIFNGKRVFITCVGLGQEGALPRCEYKLAMSDYMLSINIPIAFLSDWANILSSVVRYVISHEEQ